MRNSNLKIPIKVHKCHLSSVPSQPPTPFPKRKDNTQTSPKGRPNPNRSPHPQLPCTPHNTSPNSYQPKTRPLTPTLHPAIASLSSDPALCCELHCYRFTGKLSDTTNSAQADRFVWKVMGIIVAAVLDALVFYGNWHWRSS